jgi:RNA polymerase sigma-70 factor (ECF subfamily)
MWPAQEKTEDLLKEARAGHAEAVNRLLDRHRDSLRRMVQMRLDARIQRRVDVSDVVQDVLVEAHRRLAGYLKQPGLAFHLWLRQIAQDRIIDAHRRHRVSGKRSVDREQPLVVQTDAEKSAVELAAKIMDKGITPATAAAQREMSQVVERAMVQLEEQDHEIILLRHYEQLSNQEAAHVLGLTEPAASMRYLRAIRRLRAVLGASTGADRQ